MRLRGCALCLVRKARGRAEKEDNVAKSGMNANPRFGARRAGNARQQMSSQTLPHYQKEDNVAKSGMNANPRFGARRAGNARQQMSSQTLPHYRKEDNVAKSGMNANPRFRRASRRRMKTADAPIDISFSRHSGARRAGNAKQQMSCQTLPHYRKKI